MGKLKIQGFERIDEAKKYSRCMNSLQAVLDYARDVCPDLCRGFTTEDEIVNVSELMRLTCYKPKRQFINARSRGLDMKDKRFAEHVSGEGLQDFRVWLGGRGWESAGALGEMTLEDEKGKTVAGGVYVDQAGESSEEFPKPDPTAAEQMGYDPFKSPAVIHPEEPVELLEAAVVAAIDESNPDSAVVKVDGWSSW
jgi:hypothetical protein